VKYGRSRERAAQGQDGRTSMARFLRGGEKREGRLAHG
jgi:hypothetical protein